MFAYKQVQLGNRNELRNSLQNIYGIGWHKSILIAARIGLAYPFLMEHMNIYSFFFLSSVLDGLT
jgi:ribosomal protein S13